MPELVEVKIMSDYINHHVSGKTFTKIWDVKKGNIPQETNIIQNFKIVAKQRGKGLKLELKNSTDSITLSVFMGMSGNWLFTPTENWQDRKFTRLRLDTDDGWSLLLWGLYMGPKWRVGNFTGVKRGPDPLDEFPDFKKNVLDNQMSLTKNLPETLLNQTYFNGVGAYLTSEILGRLGFNPFLKFNELSTDEVNKLLEMVVKCCKESYELGGGELSDWKNPFGEGRIDEWIEWYENVDRCYKEKFGTRNIWIEKKWTKPSI
jgi:formamidopyrimidine-DNA glycosylase